MRLADKIPFYYLQFSAHDISCRDSVRLSRFYLMTPGVLSVDATFTRFRGFCHLFSPYSRGPNSPRAVPRDSFEQHIPSTSS